MASVGFGWERRLIQAEVLPIGQKGAGPTQIKLGPEGVGGTEEWGARNFALFFSLSRRKFHSFFSLWGVFSLNFGGV